MSRFIGHFAMMTRQSLPGKLRSGLCQFQDGDTMLGKILLTVAVILIAFALVRQRSKDNTAAASKTTAALPDETDKKADPGLARDLRIGAWMFLVLMVGLGAALYYFQWQEQHRIVTVTLHRDDQQEPITYEVYQYQLGDRSFTTVDGLTVTVAASERMVVDGLQD
jgi:lipopolysaccharide export system protein LptC